MKKENKIKQYKAILHYIKSNDLDAIKHITSYGTNSENDGFLYKSIVEQVFDKNNEEIIKVLQKNNFFKSLNKDFLIKQCIKNKNQNLLAFFNNELNISSPEDINKQFIMSIEYPNIKMFEYFKYKNPNLDVNVLSFNLILPLILKEQHEFLFSIIDSGYKIYKERAFTLLREAIKCNDLTVTSYLLNKDELFFQTLDDVMKSIYKIDPEINEYLNKYKSSKELKDKLGNTLIKESVEKIKKIKV